MVREIYKNKISDFIDRHKNTPAVVVGSASDIARYPYKESEGLVFGMGDSPLRGVNLFKTDYWVFANTYWIRPWIERDSSAIKLINPKKTFIATAIFAHQEPKSVKKKIEKTIFQHKDNIVFFDQRHSKLKGCNISQGCCVAKDILEIEHTIQEILSYRYNRIDEYSEGATVALHTLAIAILMGCNPISIVGVKIPKLKLDYTYYRTAVTDKLVTQLGSLGPYLDENNCLYYAKFTHKAKSFVKSTYKALQKISPSDSLINGTKNDMSIFAPDRVRIKQDFQFIIYNFLRMGGEIRNYSGGSLLSEIEGVLNYANE